MKKLLQFQQQMVAISKDSTNPFFKSKYFDINKLLEEVKPVLNELGLVLVQALSNIEGKPAIKTELYNVDNTEQFPLLSSTTPLPENPDPQKMGSIITYYRRYAIQTLLCLQAEDDDANLASKPLAKPVSKPVGKTVEDKQRLKIINLCKQLGIENDDYKMFVFSTIGSSLKEENFDEIIDKLEIKLEEKYNNK
jgi:hypothetical protein